MSREFFEETAISRYDEILLDFKNLAINRFEWENLPMGLTSERLETMLIEKGQVFCFKRDKGGLTILPCFNTKKLTVYGDYDSYEVYGYNGYQETISADKGVRIKNNPLASNNINNLMIYAQRIDNTEMTQDVNLFQQNVPKVVLSDESGKLTAKNLIKALKEFKFVVFGKKSLTSQLNTSEVLDTSSPYLLDKLQEHKTDLMNEVLSYLGINNNSNNDKRERLLVDEVNSNNDFINTNLDLMFDMREKACKEINEMFQCNIKVKKREVKQDGNVHDDDRGDSKE